MSNPNPESSPHKPTLTIGAVSRDLGISAEAVRKLDHVLRPERTAGGMRLYDPDVVARVKAERAARGH